jgi:hypothetical protein
MIRKFALVLGVLYLIGGVAGFIPGLTTPPHAGDPDLAIDMAHGRAMGLFPVNVLHNIVHLAIGLWGVFGSRSFGGAVTFARGLAIFYGLLAILGLIPATNTMFGLVPLYDHDVWLHAVTALIAAYFGFVAPRTANEN